MLVLDENLRVQNASRAFLEAFKVDRDETVGELVYELGNGQWDIPDLRLLLMEVVPRATAVIDYKVEHDFPGIGRRTMLVTARTLHDSTNRSHSLLLSIVDVTGAKRRDAATALVVGELRHRMKNLLAVVQSIARQTTTEARSAAEYREAFLGRFNALVEAENVAFSEQSETVLPALIERILAPYRGNPQAVEIEAGQSVELQPRIMQSLSLVLHELATNAAKYGALSVPGGQVRVTWHVDEPGSMLRLKWVEAGGPPVTTPTTTGFGTQLIKAATTYSLGGKMELVYAATGFQAEIMVPLKETPQAS